MSGDFSVSVGIDFSETLQGFKQIEQEAQKTGQVIGDRFDAGVRKFSTTSLAGLQAELSRLQQRQTTVGIDTKAFDALGVRIREVQGQLEQVQRKQTTIGIDDRSLVALQSRLSELQAKQVRVNVDSTEFADLQREIVKAERELEAVAQKKVLINVDSNSLTALTVKLQGELDKLQQKQVRVDVDSTEFVALGKEIDRVQAEIAAVERKRLLVNVDAKSVTALQVQLQDLQAKQTKLDVDSTEFADVTREISRVQEQISAVERKKLLINADPNSIVALNAKLGELQQELNQVQIGSQRFKELQQAVKETERELQKAGQSVDGFNLIDGAIQGLAFSLTNTVTNAIGSAVQSIQGLISGFAELDTEIRQAAAASGEAGAYDKLARSIDQVGIDAAGTTLEVAKLNTELIRGGMTVDQANASLGAIVRGAEATGTGFAEMGSVVSASLKGFGLEATDAKRVVDALVTGANASASSVSGMGEAFKYAAPVAKILGVSVEELGIAVGLLTNAGISASEAGVTLRNGLSKLASAAPQAGGGVSKLTGQAKMAADTMKQLGINIYNADGTLQPMETTLLKLKGAFDKLGPSSKIRLAANLFGGEDDGTKWLALLSQSESEIKKMSATMANTKGATDTARNAMQGFQMAMNQLTGTLDSLGKTLGGVAATALAPLVGLANQAVGAIAGLPTPVKAVGSALMLMAGAAVTATAAIVLFQRAMTVTAIQTAAAEIKTLSVTMATTLASAIRGVIAVIPGLLTQLSLIGSMNVGTALSALATTLKTTLVNGFTAASAAVVQFIAYLKSADFASFVAGVRSAIVALAPMAAAVAAVTGAVVALQFVLGGSKEGAETFADAQAEADKAVSALGKSIEKTSASAQQGRAPLIGYLQDAKEQMAQLAAAQGLTALQESFTKVQVPALAFLNTLKSGTAVTAEQAAQAMKLVESLKLIAAAARGTAQSLRAKAEAADRAGDPKLAAQYRAAADSLDREADSSGKLSVALTDQAKRAKEAGDQTKQQIVLTKEQEASVKERTKAEEELNKIIREAPARNLEAQLAVGQQLLGLTKAVGDLEQARFGVARSALQFQLSQLEKIGASDVAIAQKRAEIERLDRAALSAKYQALIRQQELETAILRINQEKARLDADLGVLQQRIELKKAEAELEKAKAGGDKYAIAAAQTQVDLQQKILDVTQSKVGLLQQTQPLEQASAAAQAEIARNALQSEAQMKGFRINADGSLTAVNTIADSLSKVSTFSGQSAEAQDRFRQVAEQSGLAIGKAKDGTLVLGRTQKDVNQAVGDMNDLLGKSKGGYDGAAKAAGNTKGETDRLRQSLVNAGVPAKEIENLLGKSAIGARDAKGQTDALRGALGSARSPADGIASAFVSTGKNAPAAAQGARDFASYLSSAKTFAERITGLNLADKMTAVSNATRGAASEAKRFYDWLRLASGLPGSRWTGGPVEAGGEYRINELGQEAFLSAGRLSLINAAPNSIWRAPASGVVIPAGVTARLQDTAALAAGGGGPVGVAELAIEVGKLRQEVGELARRNWDIHVQHRTGPTASQVMNQIHRLR